VKAVAARGGVAGLFLEGADAPHQVIRAVNRLRSKLAGETVKWRTPVAARR
jgi:hypothetical protein